MSAPALSGWQLSESSGDSSVTMLLIGLPRDTPLDAVRKAFELAATAVLAAGAQRGLWRERRFLVPPPRGEIAWHEPAEVGGLTIIDFGPVRLGLRGPTPTWQALLTGAVHRLITEEIVPTYGVDQTLYEALLVSVGGEA